MHASPIATLTALLIAGIGAAHSILGERLLLAPLLALERWPPGRLGERFARRTLRFAWHLTTLAWWVWAATLLLPAIHPALLIAAGLGISAAVTALISRGAHFAWPLFALAAAGALLEGLGARPLLAWLSPFAGAAAAAVLAALAALHLYWAAGGRRGLGAVVPNDPARQGAPALRPGPWITVLVALALLTASGVLLAALGPLQWALPLGPARGLAWAMAAVFALRVVGDFRWVGLFKRVRGTRFARFDDALYIPLCFFVALASGTVAAS